MSEGIARWMRRLQHAAERTLRRLYGTPQERVREDWQDPDRERFAAVRRERGQ